MRTIRIEVNEDGQFVVTKEFVGREVLETLSRKASRELAEQLLKVQGVEVAR